MDVTNLPKNTCPLCRQPALDIQGTRWTCDFCGCELDYEPETRMARIRYFPPQYAHVREQVGFDWYRRRDLFDSITVAQESAAQAVAETQKRTTRFGPLLIIALALLVACVMLGAVASALVISPSIARTRRFIAEAYRPTPTSTPEPTATIVPTVVIVVESPLAPPTAEITATVTPELTATVAALATPTAPQIATVPPQPTAPPVAIAPVTSPTLPPTFTPAPAAASIITPTAVVVTATITPTVATVPTPTTNPLQSPLPTQPGGAAATLAPGAATPVPNGAVIFQGNIQVAFVSATGIEANEADEYVELRNIGSQPVVLDGFSLKASRSADGQLLDQYLFQNGFVMAVGQTCRIYTAKVSPADNCGTNAGFESGTPLWPPTGARASLFNQQNIEQARFSY